MYALTNCTLFTGHQELRDHALVIQSGSIVDLLPEAQLSSDIQRVDGQGWAASPGFIDLQLNGCGGVMFNDAITAETLDTMHQTNLKSGTTSYLPTLITAPDEAMMAAMDLVQTYRQRHPYRVLGLHLEGPYLNPDRQGIHNPAYIRQPDEAMINRIIEAGPEVVKLLTLAPEKVPGETIERLAAVGILVSAGHTNATFEDAQAGFEAGVAMVTHLFNAMSPWQGRKPGVVGAVFSAADVYAGVIADGHHVHFASINLAKTLKQDKLVLVTDATPPVGTQMESFIIGGQEVFYKHGRCLSADGTLGGSALTMIEAIGNCVRHLSLPLAEALRMATLYPARAIGMAEKLGRLAPGYGANVTLFDPATYTVQAVIDQGQLCPMTPAPPTIAARVNRR
jgi:N-acetylglucosamine-6-phosphate deacetylase